jgi:Flp pilus assembly protein TadD
MSGVLGPVGGGGGAVGGAGPGGEAIDLVHCLGFVYLRHGQHYRAVVLLIVAAQAAPERVDILRTLCGALIAAGMGGQALDVLDRLVQLAPGDALHPMMRLMRARALLLLGRAEEAKSVFRGIAADGSAKAA